MEDKYKFAVFIDYDNIEIGVKSTLGRELDIECVLEGVKQRGEIVSKIAYGNWGHHSEATRSFSEFGIQMVQRDSTPRGDKNGADINLALDALELAFTRDHINAFAIVSGDSDFMALVNKLKQYNKRVYIVGGKQFTSTILQRNCHEFISYESLLDILPARSRRTVGGRAGRPQPQQRSLPVSQAVPLLDRALRALEVRGVQPQLGLLKSTMLQLDPAFTERDFGANAFSTFVEKLVEGGFVRVKTVDQHRVVERPAEAPAAEETGPSREEALQILQDGLSSDVELLKMGLPERELEALTRAAAPDFQEAEYGFQHFGELLNLACDQGLLRAEPDSHETLRYYPGPDLLEPGKRQPQQGQMARPFERTGERPSGRRQRRRRRRRPDSRQAPAGAPDLTERPESQDPELEVSAEPPPVGSESFEEPEPQLIAPEARAQAAPSDRTADEGTEAPARGTRKKAAKKSSRKKTARKKAAKKAS